MTKTFQANNKVRTIVGNLFVFANSEEGDRFWLTKDECRLLEEFLLAHRSFFGLPPEEKDEQDSKA